MCSVCEPFVWETQWSITMLSHCSHQAVSNYCIMGCHVCATIVILFKYRPYLIARPNLRAKVISTGNTLAFINNLSIHLSIYLSIYLPIYQSIHLSIHPCSAVCKNAPVCWFCLGLCREMGSGSNVGSSSRIIWLRLSREMSRSSSAWSRLGLLLMLSM